MNVAEGDKNKDQCFFSSIYLGVFFRELRKLKTLDNEEEWCLFQ